MKEEILKSKEELQRFMEAMIAENEILKKKIEKNN